MKALMISGDRSGSGKTSITLAIAALLSRTCTVQTFKVGMDYIDPSYLTGVSGRPCRNLDGFVMSPEELQEVFAHAASGADIAIVEGVRGLYEGAEALTDTGSTAEVAKQLDLPVILVVNARSITRSAAAVVRGFVAFDPKVRITGVILNNIGGESHKRKAIEAIEHYCGIPVVGAIPHNNEIQLTMRHLGLVPYVEGAGRGDFSERINRITQCVSGHIDLSGIVCQAQEMNPAPSAHSLFDQKRDTDVRIAIALDEAFNFYYADLFDILHAAGAELIFFSPIHDRLTEADGYIIGGGYPELFGPELQSNSLMQESFCEVSRNGIPIYAECGGLMYLTEEIRLLAGWQGREKAESWEMCGVFPGTTRIPSRRIVSYVEGQALPGSPMGEGSFRGHEFHYSDVLLAPDTRYTYRLSRGIGIQGGLDGAVTGQTIASYLHLHPVPSRAMFDQFVHCCRAGCRS